MIQVKFRRLAKSEFIKSKVTERLEALVDKFPELSKSDLIATLDVENTPSQPGRDSYTVKLSINRGQYRGVVISKRDIQFYGALSDVIHHAYETLHRLTEKMRQQKRIQARNFNKRFLFNEMMSG